MDPALFCRAHTSARKRIMAFSEQAVREVLQQHIDPNTGKDLISSKAVKRLHLDGNTVQLELAMPYPGQRFFPQFAEQIRQAVQAATGAASVQVQIRSEIVAHAAQRGVPHIPGVKNVIAVASGKGGVGKSTTAVNLALALAAEGARVGMLDADIYGPSQPTMLGVESVRPESPDGKHMTPVQSHGLQIMSIGFLIDPEQPMVWRGPMVTQALLQLINETQWDNLDYLVVDLPPGTGDIQLTLAQKVPLTGAVIVTTPQDIALIDARKGLKMFEKVNVPILGIVENMSMHICSNCGHAEPIFGEGGGARMGQDYKVELLGQLPLDLGIRRSTDAGSPTVVAEPDGQIAEIYRQIARRVAVRVGDMQQDFSAKFPKIVIQQS